MTKKIIKTALICFAACFILFAFVQRNEVLPMRAFRTVTVSFDGGETERELDKEEEKLFDEWVSKINSTCDSSPSIFVLYEKDGSERQFRISENAKKLLYIHEEHVNWYSTKYMYAEDENGERALYKLVHTNYGYKFACDHSGITEELISKLKK